MKYTDIDFENIVQLNITIENCKWLWMRNYPALKNYYLRFDEEMTKCLLKHRTLHSVLRQLDFTKLDEKDFGDSSYICNRLKKMDKGFKLLMEMYKG